MRICLVGKYPPIQGGVSWRTLRAARALAERGHEVHVVTNADEVEVGFRQLLLPGDRAYLAGLERIGVHVTNLEPLRDSAIPDSPSYATRLFGRGLQVIAAHRPDVIVGWYLEPYGVVAALLGRATGIPYVLRHAGSDIWRLARHGDLAASYADAVSGAAAIVASRNPHVRDTLRRLGATSDQLHALAGDAPMHASYDGTDVLDLQAYRGRLSSWFERAAITPALRRRVTTLGARALPSSRPTVLVYGKVGDSKGSFDLVEALARLAASGLAFNFVTVAAGWPSTLARYYETILSHRALASRTCILPPIAPWRIASLLRRATVACFLERGFDVSFHQPGVPAEILAAGTCLVATRDVVERGRFGSLLTAGIHYVAVNDPRRRAALASTLRQLLESPGTAAAIGASGRQAAVVMEASLGGHGRPDPFAVWLEQWTEESRARRHRPARRRTVSWNATAAARYQDFADRFPLYRVTSAFLVELAELRPGQRVVDLACGTGAAAAHIVGAIQPGGRLYAVDRAPDMLARAAARLAGCHVRFVIGDAARLSRLIESPVDAVICNAAFWLLDPGATIRETSRVLAPGGRFVFNLAARDLAMSHVVQHGPDRRHAPHLAGVMRTIASQRFGWRARATEARPFDYASLDRRLAAHGFRVTNLRVLELPRTLAASRAFFGIPPMLEAVLPGLDAVRQQQALSLALARMPEERLAEQPITWTCFVATKTTGGPLSPP